MQSKSVTYGHSNGRTDGYALYTETEVTWNPETPAHSGSGFKDLVAEYVSQLAPVIAAALEDAGHEDRALAERIARKVVLAQLGANDLDGFVEF